MMNTSIQQDAETETTRRNIRLDIEYDGRNYCGWQWQPRGKSIEAVVKKAAEQIVNEPIRLFSCGRTDAGVHAEQHVAHFFSTHTLPCIGILRGMNSILPNDISVYGVYDMPLSWNARHHPYEREYRYSFYCSPARSVHFHHRTYWVHKPLDIGAMNRAAGLLEGEHDFSAFRSAHCEAEHAVRCLFECRIIDRFPLAHIKIRGTAFLRHQVRTIAGTLLKVGQGAYPPERVQEILESKDRRLAAPTLPAQGLTLVAVRYLEDQDIGVTLVKRPSLIWT